MNRNRNNLTAHIAGEIPKSAGALLLIIMPKCSLCLAAYLNVFTLMGISVTRYANWLLPLLCFVMIVNMILGFLKAKKLGDFLAFSFSMTGMILLISDKMVFKQMYISWLGLALIIGSTILQLMQSRRVCNQELLR